MSGVHHCTWFMGGWGGTQGFLNTRQVPYSLSCTPRLRVGTGDSAPLTCCWGWAHWLRVRSCFERSGDWPAPGVGDSCKERCLPARTTGLGPFPIRGGGLTWANGVTMRSSACLKVKTGAGEGPGLWGGHRGVTISKEEETGQGNCRDIP